MSRPTQIPLDITPPTPRRAFGRADFVEGDGNRAALALIEGWRDWPRRRLALTGPEGAGKTHLAHIWIEAAGAEKIAADTLAVEDAPALVAAGAVAVEDVDRTDATSADDACAALFHLMNLAEAEGAALLLTGRSAPRFWPAATPDLASRLASLTVAEIAAPDDALLAALMRKHFEDRRIEVDKGVIAFLVPRIERSAAAARDVAAALDQAGLKAGRRVTTRLAREALDLG